MRVHSQSADLHASFLQYFLEVQPLLRDLPLPIFNWLESVLVEKEKDFDVIHPVPPVALPNFLKGLEGQLRYGSPEGITEAETLRFMVRAISRTGNHRSPDGGLLGTNTLTSRAHTGCRGRVEYTLLSFVAPGCRLHHRVGR